MDPRDAKIFKNSFAEISRIKALLPSRKSYYSKNESLMKLQEHYGTVIFFDPLLSLERKFEVDLWNIVFKEPLNVCIESIRKSSPNDANAYEYQQHLSALIDRAFGFYSMLMQKLLRRLPDVAWTKNILESSCTFNLSTTGRIFWGGGRFDLDAVTLQTQLTRFTRKEKAALLDTSKFVTAIEGSQQRPVVLSRGERLPDSGNFLTEMPAVKRDVSSPLKISLSEAVVYLAQYCCIHLGDLARYKHQQKSAIVHYVSAWLMDPTCGHAYNQLGVIEASKANPCVDNLFCFYVRAISCSFPFLLSKTNLNLLMNTVLDSTKYKFSKILQNLSIHGDIFEFLLFPLPMLLRFHSMVSNSPNMWAIITATNEFSLAISTLIAIVDGNPPPTDLPKPLDELTDDFAKLESTEIPPENLQKLQLRLLNAVVVHSFGLQTCWSEEHKPMLRQCMIYTTVSLINWFCATVMAVRNKCLGPENGLPVMPVLLIALALKAQCSLKDTENSKLSDSEVLQFAPPLGKSAVSFLNTLASVAISNNTVTEDLSQVNLPELFALQGFLPMGIPVFKSSFQSGPYVGLMPHSFFDTDSNLQAVFYSNRVSLIVNTFRFLAGKLPSLLEWSDVEQVFVSVDRVASSLPQLQNPAEVSLEATEINNSGPRSSIGQPKDAQLEWKETNLIEPLKDISEDLPIKSNAATLRGRAINNSAIALNPSSPLVITYEQHRMGDINTSELARFIQEQAGQVAARQRRRQEEEVAKMNAAVNHTYSSSRSNFQRDLPPRFSRLHEANLPRGTNSFGPDCSEDRQTKQFSSTLLPNQNVHSIVNNARMPPVFEPRYPSQVLGMAPSQRWRFSSSPISPFTCPGNWSNHLTQPPPMPPSYYPMSAQRPMLFNGNVQESSYYAPQGSPRPNNQNLPKSAFT